jgi:hypothetical protein
VGVRLCAFMLAGIFGPLGLASAQPNVAGDADPQHDRDIIFPHKSFLSVPTYVEVKGTLTAGWIGYKNNTYSIFCLPSGCTVASVEQIGPNQLGDINGPTVYPVVKWTNDTVVAEDEDLCIRTTITIDRTYQTVIWVDVPIHKGTDPCQRFQSIEARTATIESPPFYKAWWPDRGR